MKEMTEKEWTKLQRTGKSHRERTSQSKLSNSIIWKALQICKTPWKTFRTDVWGDASRWNTCERYTACVKWFRKLLTLWFNIITRNAAKFVFLFPEVRNNSITQYLRAKILILPKKSRTYHLKIGWILFAAQLLVAYLLLCF